MTIPDNIKISERVVVIKPGQLKSGGLNPGFISLRLGGRQHWMSVSDALALAEELKVSAHQLIALRGQERHDR